MSLIHPATKYLWTARTECLINVLKRASWLPRRTWNTVKYASAAPARLVQKYKVYIIWTLIAMAALTGIVKIKHYSDWQDAAANPADLVKIMKADGCMDWTLRNRFAGKPDPVTNEQVQGVAAECVIFWQKQNALQAQRQVLTPNP